jgi:hypothetical protein
MNAARERRQRRTALAATLCGLSERELGKRCARGAQRERRLNSEARSKAEQRVVEGRRVSHQRLHLTPRHRSRAAKRIE